VALELEALLGHRIRQARFQVGRDGFQRVRIQQGLEVLAAGVRLRIGEQAVVQAHFGFQRGGGADPGDVALDLVVVRARRARFRILEVVHVHGVTLPSASLSKPVHSTTKPYFRRTRLPGLSPIGG
jgi:hypothetical protein